ncbi:MAG: hypothetical protein AB7F35_09285 [Acetobacteraceae bacterium]
MSHTPMRSSDPAIRDLSRTLVEAKPSQVLRIVRAIDSLEIRGSADALIEPLRPRLARLRPDRPLRFDRLLFTPLDPIIIPAAQWRKSDPTLPRTVLHSLAATVRREMGTRATQIDDAIKGHTTRQRDVAARAGEKLWHAAGEILLQAPPPAAWDSSGLNIALYPALARMAGALLVEAPALEALLAEPDPAPPQAAITGLLTRAGDQNPDAIAACIVIMGARAPNSIPALAQAAAATPAATGVSARQVTEQASDVLIRQLEHPDAINQQIASSDLSEAGSAVRRIARLLDHLGQDDAPSARRDRIRVLRRRFDQSCQARFADSMAADFIMPLKGCLDSGSGADAMDLEAAARGLRALETEARAIGGGTLYDELLRKAAEAVRRVPDSAPFGRSDRVRLVEILAGPDVALAMLDQDA